MSWLFPQRLAIYSNENLPNNLSKYVQYFAKYFLTRLEMAKYFNIFPKWRNYAKDGHTDY